MLEAVRMRPGEIEPKTRRWKKCVTLLDSKSPLGAESEEKREPVSDIDTGVVDSLKALDPDGRLEKRTNSRRLGLSALCQEQTYATLHTMFAPPFPRLR